MLGGGTSRATADRPAGPPRPTVRGLLRMQIPKDQILQLIRSRGDDQQAQQADSELPDQVDTDQHAGLLGKFGINPADLLGGAGGLGGKLGL